MAAERVILLYRLREDVDRERFERWLREVEAPLVEGLDAILAYAVMRLEPTEGGQAPYDYAEVLAVSSLGAYREGVSENPEIGPFLAEWEQYVAEYVVVQGPVVSEMRKTV